MHKNVGQSFFKFNLAVLNPVNNREFALGILIDDEQHYSGNDVIENYFQRPDTMRAFGWNVIQVLSQDWLRQPEKVLEQIEKMVMKDQDK